MFKIAVMAFVMSWTTVPALAQGVGGGGGGLMHKVKQGGCIEGRRSWFTEQDPSSDRSVSVLRTCRNGSYYDLSDYVYNPKTRCSEGRIALWHVREEDRSRTVPYQCVNGRWVQRDPWKRD